MHSHRDTLKTISVVYYVIGVLLAMLLSAAAAGADLEASAYDAAATMRADQKMSLFDFSCPIAITATEQVTVRTRIQNPNDRARNYTVRAKISDGSLTMESEDQQIVPLAAGESRSFQWNVTPENVAWGRIILVRVTVPASYAIPARTETCGILFIDLPLISGGLLVAVYVAVTLIGMIGGLSGFITLYRPLIHERRKVAEGMIMIALVTVVSLAFSLLGMWKVGGAALIVAILLAISVGGWTMDQMRLAAERRDALNEQ